MNCDLRVMADTPKVPKKLASYSKKLVTVSRVVTVVRGGMRPVVTLPVVIVDR